MKTIQIDKKSAALLMLTIAVAAGSGCTLKKDAQRAGQPGSALTDPNGDLPGAGSTSAPTQDMVIGRLLGVGLAGSGVTDQSTNCGTAIAQASGNLPRVTDPIKAVGWDQVPPLVYACCADIAQDVALSVYGVDTSGTLAAQTPALINAGLKFADRYVNGLASSGQYSAQARQIFADLVNQNSQITGETTAQAFISVCMTANAFGISGRGF